MKINIKNTVLIALAAIGIIMFMTTPSISISAVGNGSPIAFQGALLFIKIVGGIAFIKGLLLLFKSKNLNPKESANQRGYIHLFSGIISINIALVTAILGNSIEPGMFLLL